MFLDPEVISWEWPSVMSYSAKISAPESVVGVAIGRFGQLTNLY